jgi:hypothetical protein
MVLLFLVLASSAVLAQDFRKTTWGMSPEEVTAAESGLSYARWKLERTFIGLTFKGDICKVDYADSSWVAQMKEKQRAEYDAYF